MVFFTRRNVTFKQLLLPETIVTCMHTSDIEYNVAYKYFITKQYLLYLIGRLIKKYNLFPFRNCTDFNCV